MNVPKLRFPGFEEEWTKSKLHHLFFITSSGDLKKNKLSPQKTYTHKYPVYGNALTNDGLLGYYEDFNSKAPSLTVTGRGDIGKAIYRSSHYNAVGRLLTLIPKVDETNSYFFKLSLDLLNIFNETTGVPQLTAPSVGNYSVSITTHEEQRKIADFFMHIDKKIQLQQEKIDLLKEQKKGFMQKIFSQELRFKDADGQAFPEWDNLCMNDIVSVNLREIAKPNEPYERLGLRSHAKGTFHETVENPENVDMDKLYIVHEGDLVINITFAWEQAFAIANNLDHGKLVSHRFPTYVFKDNHHNLFYKYYLTTKLFKYHLKNASPGGAGRNRVLNRSDFLKIEMMCPSYKEQIKIAEFLSTLDRRIITEELRLNNLTKQKQAFMQQMFI